MNNDALPIEPDVENVYVLTFRTFYGDLDNMEEFSATDQLLAISPALTFGMAALMRTLNGEKCVVKPPTDFQNFVGTELGNEFYLVQENTVYAHAYYRHMPPGVRKDVVGSAKVFQSADLTRQVTTKLDQAIKAIHRKYQESPLSTPMLYQSEESAALRQTMMGYAKAKIDKVTSDWPNLDRLNPDNHAPTVRKAKVNAISGVRTFVERLIENMVAVPLYTHADFNESQAVLGQTVCSAEMVFALDRDRLWVEARPLSNESVVNEFTSHHHHGMDVIKTRHWNVISIRSIPQYDTVRLYAIWVHGQYRFFARDGDGEMRSDGIPWLCRSEELGRGGD